MRGLRWGRDRDGVPRLHAPQLGVELGGELRAQAASGAVQALTEPGRRLAEHCGGLRGRELVPGHERERLFTARSFRTASASNTRPSALSGSPGSQPSTCPLWALRHSRSRRAAPRHSVPTTLRATASSHANGASGTSSSRRQTTRNVSETTSSTASARHPAPGEGLDRRMVLAEQRIEARSPEFCVGHIQAYCRHSPVRDTLAATSPPERGAPYASSRARVLQCPASGTLIGFCVASGSGYERHSRGN